jgi:hypothetical protein
MDVSRDHHVEQDKPSSKVFMFLLICESRLKGKQCDMNRKGGLLGGMNGRWEAEMEYLGMKGLKYIVCVYEDSTKKLTKH